MWIRDRLGVPLAEALWTASIAPAGGVFSSATKLRIDTLGGVATPLCAAYGLVLATQSLKRAPPFTCASSRGLSAACIEYCAGLLPPTGEPKPAGEPWHVGAALSCSSAMLGLGRSTASQAVLNRVYRELIE